MGKRFMTVRVFGTKATLHRATFQLSAILNTFTWLQTLALSFFNPHKWSKWQATLTLTNLVSEINKNDLVLNQSIAYRPRFVEKHIVGYNMRRKLVLKMLSSFTDSPNDAQLTRWRLSMRSCQKPLSLSLFCKTMFGSWSNILVVYSIVLFFQQEWLL